MTGGTISVSTNFAALQAKLARRAARLAEVRTAIATSTASPAKWRKARLLWPLFGQE